MLWLLRSLNPFKGQAKRASQHVQAPSMSTPPSTKRSYTNTSRSSTKTRATSIVLWNQGLVPVQIPRVHCCQRVNKVGGKHVPFTRRQVKYFRHQVAVYDTIVEESVYSSQ
ncbi:Aste57867_9061 [Aphanomyces stellatus]|uniref:Aste57867_9061 protein n=1 Tax=Aphanomyces stellatus TaxID=120398 RepID=A0A485KLV9_9STRA|nr:hypothetical protein As57867_009025 [Aphanomyces stellatus]VFT85945.1 Aste57867_9061 [Aphanomyces stellatus]